MKFFLQKRINQEKVNRKTGIWEERGGKNLGFVLATENW